MISKVFETIEKNGMLDNTLKVIVGFSGGADSVALLHFLYFFASNKEKNFKVTAVHVNHGLRGDEAQRDENFAVSFCKKLGIEIIVKKIETIEIAKACKIGLEEAGRQARYKIFESLAENQGTKIATAHTLSDSAETFLLNFTRGAALKGLCGIPPVRNKIIRPLINVTRAEIEKYCKENSLDFVHDSSNFERIYVRNKIRLDVIPYLKTINPSFESAVERTVTALSEDEKYLEARATEALEFTKTEAGYSTERLKKLPNAIKNRVAAKIIKEFTSKPVDQKHIDLLINVINGFAPAVTLPGDVKVVGNNGNLQIQNKIKKNGSKWEYSVKKLNSLTEINTDIIIKVITFSEYQKLKSESDPKAAQIFDFKKLPNESVIRNRRAGDKFTLPFRNVTKSIKKLFNELKIPEEARDKIPLIAHKSEIIWVDGLGVSKKYIPDENTKEIAIICKEPKDV